MASFYKEGSYGCIVSPPVPCEKTKAPKEHKGRKTLGKLISKSDASIELNISTLVKSIPSYQRYYIVQEKDTCTPKNFAKARFELATDCKVLRKTTDDSLLQLLSPYGGTTIERLTITPRIDFIGLLRHVLEGVAKLNAQGICHYDLHRGNVVVDFLGTPRIIDFGSAFQGDTIEDEEVRRHFYAFSPGYPPQPPELSVQNGIHQGLSIAHSITQTMEEKTVFRTAQALFGLSKESQRVALANFWETDRTWRGEGWTPFFHKFWRKWDGYAVGVMFTDLLKKCMLLPAFIQTTWESNQDTLTEVLVGLLQADPRKRFTPEQALSLLH